VRVKSGATSPGCNRSMRVTLGRVDRRLHVRRGRVGHLLAVDQHGRRAGVAALEHRVGDLVDPAVEGLVAYALGELGRVDPGVAGDVDDLVVGEAVAAFRGLVGEERLAVRLEIVARRVGGAGGRVPGPGGVVGGGAAVEDVDRMPDQADLVGRDELVEG